MERFTKGHTERQWQGKFFACGMRCFYCLEPLTLQEATKDHKLPRSRGGGDRIGNIVPACAPCNQKKGEMTAEEYLRARHQFYREPQIRTANTFISMSQPSEEKTLLAELLLERADFSWWRSQK
jgi:5-methylcytosine-specific restriction endonuclease McrA